MRKADFSCCAAPALQGLNIEHTLHSCPQAAFVIRTFSHNAILRQSDTVKTRCLDDWMVCGAFDEDGFCDMR